MKEFWAEILTLLSMFKTARQRYHGPPSDHFDGVRFFSPHGLTLRSTWDLVKWKFTTKPARWPRKVKNERIPHLAARVESGQAVLTFVNHVTMLVQVNGLNVLTDPVWSERVSPFQWAGPRRIRRPGIALKDLPKIDVVLISHNHYDHLDLRTVRKLFKRHDPLFLCALGDGRLLETVKDLRYRELDWYQNVEQGGSRFTFLPSEHWSARGVSDRNLSLWGSFMIEAPGYSVYFGGDSGYSPHFADIARKFPKIDLALLPIGAYSPRWFMKQHHMDPQDAVKAHKDLKALRSIGIHFGTWQLTDEGLDVPVRELREAVREAGLAEGEFDVMKEGETRSFHSLEDVREADVL